jgi:hypothetical protein
MLTGTFTSDGAARQISLPPGYDSFELINITDIGSAAAATPVMRAKTYSSLPAGSAYLNLKTNGAATLAIESMLAAGGAGFTWLSDSGDQTPGAAVAVTAITAASPGVVSSASGAVVGDVMRLTGTTGMLQIAGWDFTVTAVNAGVTQTSQNLIAAGFAAAATAGFIQVIPFSPRYYPSSRRITAITAGVTTIIALNVTHGYTVGQVVRIKVPFGYGMTQIDGKLGTITAIGAAIGGCTNTITVNIDSSAYTAFAFPTSATAATYDIPQVTPVGEAASGVYANLLDDATTNQSITGIIIGTGVQTTAKVYQWIARRGQSI